MAPRPNGRQFALMGAGAVAILVVIAGLIALAGISQNKAGAREWGCLYGGGMLDTPGLKKTIAPGTRGGLTVFDKMYSVPSDIRSYTIDENPEVRDPMATPIILPVQARDIVVNGESIESAGITNIALELQVRFAFNENVCDWYTEIGRGAEPLNFDAAEGTATNWTQFLNQSFQRRIREAARPIVASYDWLQLTTNARIDVDGAQKNVFDVLAVEISEELSNELTSSLGGNYFCGPTYTFDGSVDGELESCPAFEVSIEEIKPEDETLLENYEAIVANAEAQQKISSDRDRAIAQSNADADVAVAQSEADQRSQLAEQQRRQEVETAQAEADLAIAQAQRAAVEAELENRRLVAEGETAACVNLARVGVDCALLEAARQGNYPQVILGEDATPLVQVPAVEPQAE